MPLARIAAAVGTPFYVYSTASLARQYRRFAEAFADQPPLICYAVKANSNLAVLRLLPGSAPAPTSSPRASCAAPSPPACRPSASSFPASARPRRKWRRRSPPASTRSTSSRLPELRRLSAVASELGRTRAGGPAGQSRRRCADPRQDRHRQEGEQVRRLVGRGGGGLSPGRLAARHRAPGARRPYRLADRRARAVPRSLHPAGRPGARAAGERARGRPRRSRRRPRHPLSRRTAARDGRLCEDGPRDLRAARSRPCLRAGAGAGRSGRGARHPRALYQRTRRASGSSSSMRR